MVFFLLIFSSAFAQKSEVNPNGLNKFYYPDGKISSEGSMKEGKPEGYWKTYYKNGVLKSEGNRVDHLLDGSWKFYSDSGHVKNAYYYKKGKKDSLQKTIFPNGKLEAEENYKEDKKNGLSVFYDEFGHKIKTVNFIESVENGYAKEFVNDTLVVKMSLYKNGYIVKEESINRIDKKGLKQGVWKRYYSNDMVQWEGNYLNGKKNGFFKEYDLEGKVIQKDEYENDVPVVKTVKETVKLDFKKEYYPNGQIKKQGGYNHNSPEGIFIEYAEDGTITGTTTFRNGIKWKQGLIDPAGLEQGPWKEFYEGGQLKSEGSYNNGKKDGPWKYYFEDGKQEQIGAYINGKPDGPWKWYYQSGKILREENYQKGKEEGTMKEYADSSGKVISEGNYVNGKEEGIWKYKIGDYSAEGSYADGKLDGIWKHYYATGTKSFEGAFIEGLENGLHKYYYPSGRLKYESNFRLGLRDGLWRNYTEDGIIELTITYKDDQELRLDNVKISQ
jgi:antitoxin component YwqK of YwqJK toxin-antitoxin module